MTTIPQPQRTLRGRFTGYLADVEGHGLRGPLLPDEDVAAHGVKGPLLPDEDVEAHALRGPLLPDEDVEAHGFRGPLLPDGKYTGLHAEVSGRNLP